MQLSKCGSEYSRCIKELQPWSCLRADECAEVLCPGL